VTRLLHPSLTIVCLAVLAVSCMPPAPYPRGETPLLWGYTLHGYPIGEEELAAVEREGGVPARIVVFFLQWPPPGSTGGEAFPRATLETLYNRGVEACLTWEPMYLQGGEERAIPWGKILGGEYDAYLRSFARGAKEFGRPFMIRLAHEMNISRYHWGTAGGEYGPASPEIYKKIWRHVVGVFRREGALNVRFAFCPNAESLPNPHRDPGAGWNTIAAYYPGDEWVDVLGMDGYNWGTTRTKEKDGWDSSWRSFPDIFQEAHGALRALNADKPLFVFETASVTRGGDRVRWLAEALETAKRWRLAGICWFQADKDNDWRLGADGDRAHVPVIGRFLSPAPPRRVEAPR